MNIPSLSQFSNRFGHLIHKDNIKDEYKKYLRTLLLFSGFDTTFLSTFDEL